MCGEADAVRGAGKRSGNWAEEPGCLGADTVTKQAGM